MIHVKDLAKKIQKYLHQNGFDDIKIFIRINFSLDVFVFSDNNISADTLKEGFWTNLAKEDKDDDFYKIERNNIKLSFRIISSEERNDPFYANVVSSENEIIMGPRYRYDSLLDINNGTVAKEPTSQETPIITFYSYKGGMGRTTTMVAYAMDLAINNDKRVVIIDCDLEAPGYLNFFDLSKNDELLNGKKNGLVEFMSDLQMLDNDGRHTLDLNDYIINVGNTQRVDGVAFENLNNIWLIPAGNLNMDYGGNEDESNLRDYLEGLSKVNLSNVREVVDSFSILFTKIKETINPDVILLDSRTGFNDIFGTAAFYLSSCVVGFFGFSRQTQPGLINLINNYYIRENTFKIVLVFSILPTDEDSMTIEDKLYSEVSRMIDRKATEEKDKPLFYSLHRNHNLEQIGIGEKQNDERFVKLVKEKRFEDFNALFQGLSNTFNLNQLEDTYVDELSCVNTSAVLNTNDETKSRIKTGNDEYSESTPALILRNIILRHLKSVFANIKLFAEDTNIEESQFFYRGCMKTFFEPDKFIIKGYKGTGKTYLYRALGNQSISSNIQRWAGLDDVNETTFIQILPDTPDSNIRQFPFDLIQYNEIDEPEYYFNCFWQIYTWNSILCNDAFTEIRETSELSSYIKPIGGNEALERFEDLINKGTSTFVTVEKDLDKVNDLLEGESKRVFVLYDRLDNCINPLRWNKAVSPLIEYWRNNYRRYSNIFPKIFIRTDLFRQIEGNNTERLQENSINIEWTIGEVFGYFFKLIFSDKKASAAYWAIAKKLHKNDSYINNCKKSFETFPQNQFKSLNRAEMAPLVEIFFGRQVISGALKLGHPWEYFEKELSNADNNSISLRPFINTLDSNAVDRALGRTVRYVKEIISSSIYASKDVREKATDSYFNDLAKDPFSKDLLKLRDFIRSDQGNDFKYKSLKEAQYAELLKKVFATIQESKVIKTEKDLDNMISANGIMARKPTTHGIYYVFAPIYFYSWGLHNGDLEKENKQGYKREEINFKRNPKEGIEYHGHIEKRTLYGRHFYVAVPNESERLNITSFKIENKPIDLNEDDKIIFTVFSEPYYANNDKLFWKVKKISLDE